MKGLRRALTVVVLMLGGYLVGGWLEDRIFDRLYDEQQREVRELTLERLDPVKRPG